MKKIKLLLPVLAVLLFCAAACGPFENFDNDAAIISGSSFSTSGSVTKTLPGNYSLSAKKCNGVHKITTVTVGANHVFDITLEITSGLFKMVAIKDNTVYVICDSDTDKPVATDLEAGTYVIKIVAKDARIKFAYKY